MTANGYSDWVEFYIEDGGQTISSNDAFEVAERGGVCCKRGTASNAFSPPVVTGLEHDLEPELEKTFTWECDQSNCKYRYAINKYSSHTFLESTAYTNTTTITKAHGDRRAKYYLHVQAASLSRESAVRSVSFILMPPVPPKVIGLEDDPTPKAVKVWRWNCDKGSCTYRYAINQNQNHTFTNESYGQDRIATKRITNANENGTYYLHVQAMDSDSNESEVETVLAILEISTSEEIHVTGLSHDTNAGSSKTWNWGCDSSSCTYRHVINQNQEHTFTNEDLYNSTQRAGKTITSASENGTYFLHVQAKDANNNESEVETVVVVLEIAIVINDVFVTGLSHDTNAGASKTWNWGCDKSSCTYRYVINQSQSHTFAGSGGYGSTQRVVKTITSANDNGTYYLHVQAKDANNNESEVETVLAVLAIPTTSTNVLVTGLLHDTNAGTSKTWTWGCSQSSCTYRYVINQAQAHQFGNTSYGSATTATKSISSASEDGTYYLHVQAKDSNNDESEVKTVLAVFEVSQTTSDVQVTGLGEHDTNAGSSKTWNWGCNKSSCTYRYVINQTQTHNFGSASYGSTQRAVKTITSANDNGTYYLHVQAKDANNNESNVETVLAVFEIPTTASDVLVTGLAHDTNAGTSKTWNWGCSESSCTYRAVINQNSTHTFGSTSYGSATTATKSISSANENGTYYLHVQAKDSNDNESNIETVLAVFEIPTIASDVQVTGLAHDTNAGTSKTWNWGCNKSSCTYRYAVNQTQTHNFGNASYGSTQRAVKTITSANENGTYYLHAQAKDSNDNESNVETVLAVLEISTTASDVLVTGLLHDTSAGTTKTWNWGCDKSSCTYRYAINQAQAHQFGNASYGSTTTAAKSISSANENGTYYLHVQAKDSNNNESEVETVLAIFEVPETTSDVEVTGLAHDTVEGSSKTWTWGCNKGSCTYRAVINQTQTHTFGSARYGSATTATKSINSVSENGTYYIHVQARDSNNNESEVTTVLAILKIPTATSDVQVTGLLHDDVAKTSKTWNWGCNQGSCTYRYAVNQTQTHTFGSTSYGSTQTVTKSISSASDNGIYYLHIQAKDSNNNESEVETVLAVLEVPGTTSDVQVTGLAHDTVEGSSKTWNWGCNKGSCTYRAVINQSQTHTFGSASYGSATRATKSINSVSENGTYYLHVQAKDSAGNESEVTTVLAVLKIPTATSDVQVTGLLHDDVAKTSKTWNWGCNQGSCTYRYAVNQAQTHNFGRTGYGSTQRAVKTISSASENGVYYLHVQAKDSNNNESEVKTVIAILEIPETTTTVQVTGLLHDDVPKTSKTWSWGCNRGSCTYRYAVNQAQSHTFSSGGYTSNQSTSKTITAASENGVYYLHVQARDSNNNESEVKTVIAIFEISSVVGVVQVTGLSHDTDPKRSKTWTWGCDSNSCTYRHTVNQSQTHTFSGSDRYRSTQTATKQITSSSQNGTYYLHVQAKDGSNNESQIETVLVILRYSGGVVGDLAVTGVDDDIMAKGKKVWRWYCTNNSGACSYRYVVNQSGTHTFPDSHSFDSSQMAERTASVDDDNGTYYLHVQARDGANNLSAIRTVVAYLSKSPVELTLNCSPAANTVGKTMTCIWSGGTVFRYKVSESATYIFGVNHVYDTVFSETIDVAGGYNAGTTYYLHVQGRDQSFGNLSNIETRFITLTAKAIEVKFVEDETKKLNKMSTKWKWECNETASEPATKPCVYRYAVTQSDTHDFDNEDGYGTIDELTKTLTYKGEDGTYYLHVQTKDADNNVSEVKSSDGVELAFELDLALKTPEPHTETINDEEVPTSLQLHLNKTPTFTLRGVLDNHKVTLYSSSECTNGSNDGNGDPTQDTRLSNEITMSSGQVDITISNDKFSDLTTYPIYVGVKDSNNDVECYAATDVSDDTPVIVDDTNKDTVVPLFEYTRYNPIAGGLDKTCYLLPDGDVKCWGNNVVIPDSLDSKKAKAVVVGGVGNRSNNICRILSDDIADCTGGFILTQQNTDKVKAIALGGGHACSILKEDNSVYCDGSDNDKGQLGLADSSLTSGTVDLGCDGTSGSCDELKAKAIVAGDNHTCVILLDDNEINPSDNFNDRVLCWGYNAKGQLGQDDTLNHGAEPDANSQDDQPSLISSLPYINLGSGRTAKSITAGQNHTCALLDNNTVKCWGYNILGQLGQNNVIDYGTTDSNPNRMSDLGSISLGRNAAAIFTGIGSNHTCAVLDNNTVKCWGNNWKGQLGQNDSTNVDGGTAIGSDASGFLDGSEILINRNHGSGNGSDVPLKAGEPRNNVQTRTVSNLSTIQFGCNNATDRNQQLLDCTSSNNFKLKVPYGLAVGKDHVCALLETDQQSDEGKDFVKCWGSNDDKQLGHDEEKNYGSSTTDSVEEAPALEFPME